MVASLDSATGETQRVPAAGGACPDRADTFEPIEAPRLGEQILAVVALFALGLRQFVHSGITTGFALALVLIPLWVRYLRFYRGARVLMALFGLASVSGIVLNFYGSRLVDVAQLTGSTVLLLGSACGVGVILWAREVLQLRLVGAAYGFGMICGAVAGFTSGTGGNPWKFVWAVPVAVFTLSLVRRRSGVALELVALAALAGASIAFDSRSYFATFLLAALVVVFQRRAAGPQRTHRRKQGSAFRTVAFIALLMGGVYYLGTTLLVNGYLGQAAQERSIAQIQTSGSLILGGRPELSATIALMKHSIWGFGAGAVPTPSDILIAKTGLNSIHLDPNNGYVERFMFGGRVELHSVFGDLWAQSGIAGLILVAYTAYVVVRGVAEQIAGRIAGAAVLFLAFWTLWNTFFSPIYAADPTLILGLGLLLGRRRTPGPPTVDPAAAAGRVDLVELGSRRTGPAEQRPAVSQSSELTPDARQPDVREPGEGAPGERQPAEQVGVHPPDAEVRSSRTLSLDQRESRLRDFIDSADRPDDPS